MSRQQRMHSLLTQALAPASLEITDDSARHIGHAGAAPGGETHYSLFVVSEKFASKSKVQRHQLVYAALADEFKTGLHALAITAKAPGEA